MQELDRSRFDDLSYVMHHLDEVFSCNDAYRSIQNTVIGNAVQHHLENNKGYADYCEESSFVPSEGNYRQIPLLPSSLFKRPGVNLRSSTGEDIVKWCVSSGTRGSTSRVPRDETTLSNFLGSLSSTIPTLFGIERTGNHKAFVLGPPTEEAGDLWFSYVLSTMSLSLHSSYFVKDDLFNVGRACDALQRATDGGISCFVVGPPFRIIELCRYIQERNISLQLTPDSFVITAGGWKSQQQRSIPRDDYQQVVRQVLGVPDAAVRDSFNMVELNTVLHECEFHEKHVPPWIDIAALHPVTHEPIVGAEGGILAFYDGSALSFPCFILSEDYGSVTNGLCRCGRSGNRVQIHRRMEGIEARGCALKMASGGVSVGSHNANRFHRSIYRNPKMFVRKA